MWQARATCSSQGVKIKRCYMYDGPSLPSSLTGAQRKGAGPQGKGHSARPRSGASSIGPCAGVLKHQRREKSAGRSRGDSQGEEAGHNALPTAAHLEERVWRSAGVGVGVGGGREGSWLEVAALVHARYDILCDVVVLLQILRRTRERGRNRVWVKSEGRGEEERRRGERKERRVREAGREEQAGRRWGGGEERLC
eukprot:3435527-Rhodomonas_salina.2